MKGLLGIIIILIVLAAVCWFTFSQIRDIIKIRKAKKQDNEQENKRKED